MLKKDLYNENQGFSSSCVQMWELDYKENWAPKNQCFWTVVLGKTLESSLVCKDIKPVNPKGNQPWIFIGRTDAYAETQILWSPDEKNWLPGNNPDAGKDWRQEEKGTIEDEMVGWHCWLSEHEFEQALGVGDGQGGLACCSPWGRKSWTWLSNWTELNRGWDRWMVSQTQWTWVWVNSGIWWWTGRPGMLQFMGSQRVGHDRAAELNWNELKNNLKSLNRHFFKEDNASGQ